jgi:hypothetical protein
MFPRILDFRGLSYLRGVLWGWTLALAIPSAAADESAMFEAYLSRLGLVDLQLALLEQELPQASAASQPRLAARLAELYAARLLTAGSEPAGYAAIEERLQRLLAVHKELSTPALQIALLQAEYQRVEQRALAWLDDPRDQRAQQQALEQCDALLPRFATLRAALEKQIEDTVARFDAVEPGSSRTSTSTAALDAAWQREQEQLQRTLYFQGWTQLLRILLQSGAEGVPLSPREPLATLGRLLELSPDAETFAFEADSLGLASVWRARAMLGFMASLQAEGKGVLAEECRRALQHADDSAVRSATLYWSLLPLLRAELWEAAEAWVEEHAAGTSADFAASHVPCAILLVRSAWCQREPSAPWERLAERGLAWLAKLKKYEALTALVARYRPEPLSGDGFLVHWTHGKLLFAAAEKEPSAARYAASAKQLRRALELPTAGVEPLALALCEYTLSWCEFRQEQWAEAAARFEKVSSVLELLGDRTAAEAAWMVYASHQARHSAYPHEADAQRAEQALTHLVRKYPDSDQARRAKFVLQRLRAAPGKEAEYLQQLASEPVDSPNYLAARFDLVLARHKQWREMAASSAARPALGEQLRRDVQTYLQAAPVSAGARRVQAALRGCDVWLATAEPAWPEVKALLDTVAASAERLAESDPLQAEYRYRRLQLAQQERDAEGVRTQALWLAAHARESPYETAALVAQAQWLDQRYASSVSEAERTALRAELFTNYSRLSEHWGTSAETLQTQRNAAVALARLATVGGELGRHGEAAGQWEQLAAAFPREAVYILRAARARTLAGDTAAALEHWNTLVAGGTPGTNDWFEAKHEQLSLLRQIDPAAAEKGWKQFQLLYPEVPQAWRERFQSLGRALGSEKP